MKLYCIFVLIFGSLSCSQANAAGEQIIDAIMRSDFVFDRNISNVPFLPLSYLQFSENNSLEIEGDCAGISCDFSYQSISQGLGLPVWVGQKHMLILGESLESDEIKYRGEKYRINSAGIIGAWLVQPSRDWQAGAFIYAYQGFGEGDLAREPKGSVSGVVSRFRHQPKFHSYWGFVRLQEYDDVVVYPYAGFDWLVGLEWSISALLPWPTVSYAPTKNRLFKAGALFSGSQWVADGNEQLLNNSFEKVDFGLAFEQRIRSMLWGELSVGYSGFGKVSIESSSELVFEGDIASAPYIRFSLNLRPES